MFPFVAVVVVVAAVAVFLFVRRASVAKEVAREAKQGDALVAKVSGAVASDAAKVAAVVSPAK